MNKAGKKSVLKLIFLMILAAILCVAAIFALWWYGAFLPKWVNWQSYETSYENLDISISDKSVTVLSEGKIIWKTPRDWFVQDMIITDINKDNIEEIVLLVWKHGSYGKHKPMWVKRNDIRLEQHIFIYEYDSNRDERIRPIWMSSTIGYEINSIDRCYGDKLVVNNRNDQNKVWFWQDFGLKAAGEAKEHSVKLVCAGDNLIHAWMLKLGEVSDFDYVNGNYDSFYEHIHEKIEDADIATINQETPLVTENSLLGDYPKFGTPGSITKSLSKVGFDVVSCANNHILDRGEYGAFKTYELIADNNMIPVGLNVDKEGAFNKNITFLDKNNIKIAFLSYTYGTNKNAPPKDWPYLLDYLNDEERIIKELRYAKARADVVIVFAHWGEEYQSEPNDEQKRLTELFYKEGVDVVIGTHPHVLQPMENFSLDSNRNMLVYYSLGNFVNGQNKEECLTGGLGTFEILKHKDGSIEILNPDMEEVVMHQDKDDFGIYLKEVK